MAEPATKGKGKCYLWLVDHAGHQDDACLVWPFFRNPNGYGQLGYLGVQRWAHRIMCQLVHGDPPEGHEAAHSCGNGASGCVNPRHLSWKTKSQNRFDALKHGTGVRHARGPRGSLTPEQVAEIRGLQGKKRQVDIAVQFGISEPRVRAIFSCQIYKAEPKIPYWTEEEEQKLRDGVAAGFNFSKIGKIVGKKAHTVASKAYRLGLKSGQAPHPNQRYVRSHNSL